MCIRDRLYIESQLTKQDNEDTRSDESHPMYTETPLKQEDEQVDEQVDEQEDEQEKPYTTSIYK